MNRAINYVGPRGWAILTLAGGAALASPFLKQPRIAPPSQLAQDTNSPDSCVQSAALEKASLTEKSFLPNPATSSQHSFSPSTDSQESYVRSRAVTGTLPSTSIPDSFEPNLPAELPDWAAKQSKLDALIAGDISALEAPPNRMPLQPQPLEPWLDVVDQQSMRQRASDQLHNSLDDQLTSRSRYSPWHNEEQRNVLEANSESPIISASNSLALHDEAPSAQDARIGEHLGGTSRGGLPMIGRPVGHSTRPEIIENQSPEDSTSASIAIGASLRSNPVTQPIQEQPAPSQTPRPKQFIYQPSLRQP